ncbi:ribonuclease P protein component [Nocardioides sp.]|uniref:ribonuclease P protein component n=1 Tax=Nocardioides sp. TaxID=35761 RepID=UPI002ED39B91
MLPSAHRLTDAESFRAAVRRGRRARADSLVVHLLVTEAEPASTVPRAGFVVSKAVGNAVIRNRVQRRLRHLVREQLDSLPRSAALVVRALPAAATATYAELRTDLTRCLQQVTAPGSGRRGREVSAS